MVYVSNTFDNGVAGATVTAGDTSSGTPFGAVSIGVGCALTHDATFTSRGPLAAKLATGVSAGLCGLSWTSAVGAQSTVWMRGYFYFTAWPSAQTPLFDLTSGGVFAAGIYLLADGTLRSVDSTGTLRTSTVTVPLSQWVRVEAHFIGDIANGFVEFKLFTDPWGSTAAQTQTSDIICNTLGVFDDYGFGGRRHNVPASYAFWVDDPAVSTTGYVGSEPQPGGGPTGVTIGDAPPTRILSAVEYTILVTDESLHVIGDPITCWDTIDVTLRFNEPSSGLITVRAYQWIVDLLVPGCRIVIIRNFGWPLNLPAQLLIAGPVEDWLIEQADNGENAGDGKLTLHFADDLALVVARCVYPDPTLTPSGQVTDSWTYTGNAELALRSLVDLNAGPGARAERRVPNMELGDIAGVGSTVTITADLMEPIGNVLRRGAKAGGGLGFRTRQNDKKILFDVYQPADLSGTVRFGFNLGNMQYRAAQTTAPTSTAAIVGGQGTGADRFLIERVNATDQTRWGRMETLVSRPGTSALQSLQDDGDTELADTASTTRLSFNVSDTPDIRYGIHYDLGSVVAVESGPGTQIADVVVTVHLQAWATAGEYVSSSIGSQAAKTDPIWVSRLQQIADRLALLERTAQPSA